MDDWMPAEGFEYWSDDWSSGFCAMMTAPGIAIVNPNPKIAAINLDFDFIDTSLCLLRDTISA